MLDNIEQKFVEPEGVCLSQLRVAKEYSSRADELSQRIALILVHNASEVALRNLGPRASRNVERHGGWHECEYKLLLNSLCRHGEMDEFDRFVMFFMHRLRNTFYHGGMPQGLDYGLRVPKLLANLVVAYLNMTSDMIVRSYPSLSERVCSLWKPKKPRITAADFAGVRYDHNPTETFVLAADALVRFYVDKCISLSEMADYVLQEAGAVDPNTVFKWSEFWTAHPDHLPPDRFKTEFSLFQQKFDYSDFTRLSSVMVKAVSLVRGDGATWDRPKIAGVLTRADSLSQKYEDVVVKAFVDKDTAVQLAVDVTLGK